MRNELRKLILNHWLISKNQIRKIESGSLENFWIKNQSYYLNPVINKNTIVPLNNERGLYAYYTKIKEDLKLLFLEQKLEYTYHFNGAPEEIKSLLDKS